MYIFWRRKWLPTPVLLPGKSHGWKRLVGYSPWCRKELDTTERLHFFSHVYIYVYIYENVYSSLLSISKLNVFLLNCRSSSYVVDINPLLDI